MPSPRGDRDRDELLALLGHELRNPLGPIRNAVYILRGRCAGDPQSAWALALIERQLEDLLAIIESVSEVSRIARGKVTPTRTPFPVARAVTDAVAASEPALARKQQTCSVKAPAADVIADGDRARIEQAVRALVQATSRWLPTGASIALEVGVAGERLTVCVKPDGASPAEAQTGHREAAIGEILARALAEVMGGTLIVRATADDAPFYELDLPLAAI